jgi:hypothetical protein
LYAEHLGEISTDIYHPSCNTLCFLQVLNLGAFMMVWKQVTKRLTVLDGR